MACSGRILPFLNSLQIVCFLVCNFNYLNGSDFMSYVHMYPFIIISQRVQPTSPTTPNKQLHVFSCTDNF